MERSFFASLNISEDSCPVAIISFYIAKRSQSMLTISCVTFIILYDAPSHPLSEELTEIVYSSLLERVSKLR